MFVNSKCRTNLFILLSMLLLFPMPGLIVRGQVSTLTPSPTARREELEEEKLRQETHKLELEIRKLNNSWDTLLSFGTLATALVAVGGLIATLWKQITENNRQRELDRDQRERDRQQREDEIQKKLEEKFAVIVTNLGSDSASLQASAAVQIMAFLEPEYQNFHRQAFLILYANLRVQHNQNLGQNQTLGKLLVAAFQQVIRTQLGHEGAEGELGPIDLSRSYLNRADLHSLDLTGADIAFSDLRGAMLSGSTLFRVRGYEVNLEKARLSRATLGEARLRGAFLSDTQFHNANLVAADLRETDLTRAQFQQAKMQSAHLDRAVLTGARFEQANLNDTFFFGAQISTATLKSILKAQNWDKAHFDPPVWATLQALAT